MFTPGTLTRPAWAWLTKYMPYTDLKMKPNAARPMTKTPRLKVTAFMRPNALMPWPPSLILRALVKLSRCRVASTSPMLTMSPARCEVIKWRRVEISCGSRFWNWQPARPVWRSKERTCNSTSMAMPRLSMTNCKRALYTWPMVSGSCPALNARPPADRSMTRASTGVRSGPKKRSLAGIFTRACWRWASDSCTTLALTAVFIKAISWLIQ
ncbi:hypothetical protein D3C72_919080 [compost metagenome]